MSEGIHFIYPRWHTNRKAGYKGVLLALYQKETLFKAPPECQQIKWKSWNKPVVFSLFVCVALFICKQICRVPVQPRGVGGSTEICLNQTFRFQQIWLSDKLFFYAHFKIAGGDLLILHPTLKNKKQNKQEKEATLI